MPDQRLGLLGRKRPELHGRRFSRWTCLQQLRACETQDQEGDVSGRPGDVLEEVEQRRLRPVGVLDDQDVRPRLGQRLEQPAKRPHGLFSRPVLAREAERSRDRVGDDGAVALSVQEPGQSFTCLAAGRLADHLAERPERDPLTIGETAPDQSGPAVGHFLQQLAGEPRLPDPRRSHYGQECRLTLHERVLERLQELGELCPPSHERRFEAPRERRRTGQQRPEAERRGTPATARRRRRWRRVSESDRRGRSPQAPRRVPGRAPSRRQCRVALRFRRRPPRPWRSRCAARARDRPRGGRGDRPPPERRGARRPRAATEGRRWRSPRRPAARSPSPRGARSHRAPVPAVPRGAGQAPPDRLRLRRRRRERHARP